MSKTVENIIASLREYGDETGCGPGFETLLSSLEAAIKREADFAQIQAEEAKPASQILFENLQKSGPQSDSRYTLSARVWRHPTGPALMKRIADDADLVVPASGLYTQMRGCQTYACMNVVVYTPAGQQYNKGIHD